MQKNTSWKITAKNIDKKSKDWLTKTLAINRNLNTKKQLEEFLNPSFEQVTTEKITDIKKAVTRIKTAIVKKEKIVVYSDYDADGISATAIMWETLFDLGANVMPYVPHRIKEGYGLTIKAISELSQEGVKLIITVDHGVTANEQVEHAKSLGVDVIISDHHVLPKNLPKSTALVHTTSLCGAGVSWRLAWELISEIAPNYKNKLKEKLELAAIATIADLVPLLGANRAIVALGLEILSKTKRPGILALMRAGKITPPVRTFAISHMIAPRINAMGRIEHGLDALRLLCAKNEHQAASLATLLAKTNSKRQDLTTSAVETAKRLVSGQDNIGVLSHSSWHEGVIGLVASRMVEAHSKPFVIISEGKEFSKGSARSVLGFNILDAIKASGTFINVGGHPMAAGFTIETKRIKVFTQRINKYAQIKLTGKQLTPQINIECAINSEDINRESYLQIKQFEPYGMGNPQPIFLTKKMLVEDLRSVGSASNHLKLQLSGHNAIAFNMGQLRAQLRPGQEVDVAYSIEEDRYNGNNKLQLKVKDIKVN